MCIISFPLCSAFIKKFVETLIKNIMGKKTTYSGIIIDEAIWIYSPDRLFNQHNHLYNLLQGKTDSYVYPHHF